MSRFYFVMAVFMTSSLGYAIEALNTDRIHLQGLEDLRGALEKGEYQKAQEWAFKKYSDRPYHAYRWLGSFLKVTLLTPETHKNSEDFLSNFSYSVPNDAMFKVQEYLLRGDKEEFGDLKSYKDLAKFYVRHHKYPQADLFAERLISVVETDAAQGRLIDEEFKLLLTRYYMLRGNENKTLKWVEEMGRQDPKWGQEAWVRDLLGDIAHEVQVSTAVKYWLQGAHLGNKTCFLKLAAAYGKSGDYVNAEIWAKKHDWNTYAEHEEAQEKAAMYQWLANTVQDTDANQALIYFMEAWNQQAWSQKSIEKDLTAFYALKKNHEEEAQKWAKVLCDGDEGEAEYLLAGLFKEADPLKSQEYFLRGAKHGHKECYKALAGLELIQGNDAQAEQWAILYHGGKQRQAYAWLASFDFLPYEKAAYYRKLGHKASRLRVQDVQEVEVFAQAKGKRSVYEKLAQKDAEIGDYLGAEGKLRQSYRDKYGEEDGASVFFALGKFLKNKNPDKSLAYFLASYEQKNAYATLEEIVEAYVLKKNYDEAERWAFGGAPSVVERKNRRGYEMLAKFTQNGDPEKYLDYLQRAAEAQSSWACMHFMKYFLEQGDYVRAENWAFKLYRKDRTAASFEQLKERLNAMDPEKALNSLENLALSQKDEHVLAYLLQRSIRKGQEKEAQKWAIVAKYDLGEGGILDYLAQGWKEFSLSRAITCWEEASKKGYKPACLSLAKLYAEQKDCPRAEKWAIKFYGDSKRAFNALDEWVKDPAQKDLYLKRVSRQDTCCAIF